MGVTIGGSLVGGSGSGSGDGLSDTRAGRVTIGRDVRGGSGPAAARIQSGAPATEVEARALEANKVLAEAREKLGGEALSGPATFTAALIILLREGLEAVLVLAAIFAFLGKAERGDAKRYVHMGWIAALALGALTWVVSNRIIAISGASREVTEGVTALISAAMLLYVGFWLHDKSHAQGWQKFINAQVGGNIWFGTGPYQSLDDAKLARSTIRSCPAVEEPPAETPDNEKKSD